MESQLEQLLLQMQIGGFCILENVIPADHCAAIRESLIEVVQRQRGNYPSADCQTDLR